MPSPVGPRQGHLASGAMHPPLLLLLLLHFPRLSLRLWARLMHHASSLHFSYPVLRRLVYIADSAVSLSLSLFISFCRSIHGQISYTVTAIAISLFIRLPCLPVPVCLASCDPFSPLSSLATPSYRRRSARDAHLSFRFLSR